MNKIFLLVFVLCLTSCSNMIRPGEGAESVHLAFPGQTSSNFHFRSFESTCDFVGEVIGSDGHWYSNMFVDNSQILQGAINDLKNNAFAKGSNIVFVYDDIEFATSVTLLGQAYICRSNETTDKARF